MNIIKVYGAISGIILLGAVGYVTLKEKVPNIEKEKAYQEVMLECRGICKTKYADRETIQKKCLNSCEAIVCRQEFPKLERCVQMEQLLQLKKCENSCKKEYNFSKDFIGDKNFNTRNRLGCQTKCSDTFCKKNKDYNLCSNKAKWGW